MTVKELRDKLDHLISCEYGDLPVAIHLASIAYPTEIEERDIGIVLTQDAIHYGAKTTVRGPFVRIDAG